MTSIGIGTQYSHQVESRLVSQTVPGDIDDSLFRPLRNPGIERARQGLADAGMVGVVEI